MTAYTLPTQISRIARATSTAAAAVADLQREIDAAGEIARSMKAACEKLAGRNVPARLDDIHPADPDLVLPTIIRPRDASAFPPEMTGGATTRREPNGAPSAVGAGNPDAA